MIVRRLIKKLTNNMGNAKYRIGGIAALLAAGVIGLRSCTIVPAGNVGVRDLFGDVSAREIPSGLHAKHPLAQIRKMSIKTQEYTMSIASEEGERQGRSDTISALTKEGLPVDLDVTVLYRLNPEKASDVYKTIGMDYAEIVVRPKIREAIRSNAALYMAKEMYSEKRQDLQNGIRVYLSDTLTERGIEIEDVLLRHIGLPEKLKAAIEEKLSAEQEAQRMEFVLDKERKEAERKEVEAGGLAKAQGIIAESLTPEYLQWRYITTLEGLVDSQNTTFVITPYDQKLIPMLPLEQEKQKQ